MNHWHLDIFVDQKIYLFFARWDILCCVRGSKKDRENSEGMLYRLFKHLYAPFLLKKWVRAAVIVIFFGWTCSSIAVVPKIEIGLDQEISMPDNSFVLKYFTFLKEYLSVGPPVYFVGECCCTFSLSVT